MQLSADERSLLFRSTETSKCIENDSGNSSHLREINQSNDFGASKTCCYDKVKRTIFLFTSYMLFSRAVRSVCFLYNSCATQGVSVSSSLKYAVCT